jgi:hypothetical protein
MAQHVFEVDSLTIGSKVFIVHRKYAFQNKPGGKVVLARVVSFSNRNGNIEIDFRAIGQTSKSSDLGMTNYIPFINIQKAIDSIKSELPKKEENDGTGNN